MKNLRDINIVESELSEIKNEIKNNEKEITFLFDKIRVVFSSFKDNLHFNYSLFNGKASFYINFGSTCSIRCFLSDDNTVVNTTEYIDHQYDEIINENSALYQKAKKLMTIVEARKNLTEKLLFEVLTGVKYYKSEHLNLTKNLEILEEEYSLCLSQSKIQYLNKAIKIIDNFCVYSFLAKKFNLDINGTKPTRKEISNIKSHFKYEKKVFYFIIREFGSEAMYLNTAALHLENGKMSLFVYRKQFATYRTIKGINEILSLQFTFQNTFVKFIDNVQNIIIPEFRPLAVHNLQSKGIKLDILLKNPIYNKEFILENVKQF